MEAVDNLPSEARLWVYQCDRLLTEAEEKEITMLGSDFVNSWSAHGAALKAAFEIRYHAFIVIAVDEKQALASGCSIDKSVHFIKSLEQRFGLRLFERMNVAYRDGDSIQITSFSNFEKLAKEGQVNASTIVFNNMVSSLSEFKKGWEVPLKESWQNRVLA
jgi:hypothetical protein